jgi:hypothetical protein
MPHFRGFHKAKVLPLISGRYLTFCPGLFISPSASYVWFALQYGLDPVGPEFTGQCGHGE